MNRLINIFADDLDNAESFWIRHSYEEIYEIIKDAYISGFYAAY